MKITEARFLPWILVLVLFTVALVQYNRANTTETRLRSEIMAYHACLDDRGYSREGIESQCLADWVESRESVRRLR